MCMSSKLMYSKLPYDFKILKSWCTCSEKSQVDLGNWHNEGCLITQVSLKETQILCKINTNIMKIEFEKFAA